MEMTMEQAEELISKQREEKADLERAEVLVKQREDQERAERLEKMKAVGLARELRGLEVVKNAITAALDAFEESRKSSGMTPQDWRLAVDGAQVKFFRATYPVSDVMLALSAARGALEEHAQRTRDDAKPKPVAPNPPGGKLFVPPKP